MKCARCKFLFEKYNKGHNTYCKPCKRLYQKEWYWKSRSSEKQRLSTKRCTILASAKKRARKYKVPFDLQLSDVVIPDNCPVLGAVMPIDNKKPSPNSPTLDRIIPELGYVKGNVAVISMKANLIKSNATHEEIQMVADWVKSKTNGH